MKRIKHFALRVLTTGLFVAVGAAAGRIPAAAPPWLGERELGDAVGEVERTDEALGRLDDEVDQEPGLRPLSEAERRRLRGVRRHAVDRVVGASFDQARARFEVARREAAAGSALIDSATALVDAEER